MASPPSPPASPLSKPTASHQPLLPIYLSLSKTTSRITPTVAHLSALLSTTPHLDTTLLTTTYTLHLLHSLLARSRHTASLSLTTTLAPLTALLDEFRIFLRLWGLLGIYAWGASTYANPPRDRLIKGITWAQVAACAVFQALENGAYLSERGILGWDKRRVARAWVWSSRAWMVHVVLELVRLGHRFGELSGEDWMRRRRNSLRKRVEEGEVEAPEGFEGEMGKGEVEVGEEKRVAEEEWRKFSEDLGVNAAYAPMTVHYSFEKGFLGEGNLGVLGCVVGWLTFGKAWKESA